MRLCRRKLLEVAAAAGRRTDEWLKRLTGSGLAGRRNPNRIMLNRLQGTAVANLGLCMDCTTEGVL